MFDTMRDSERYYVILRPLTSTGSARDEEFKSGPFIYKGISGAEEALIAALGSGKFASGQVVVAYPPFETSSEQ